MKEQLEYKILQKPTPEIYNLLESTVYGTKGFRYSHGNSKERLDFIGECDFHTLWEGETLVALAAYCKRITSINDKKVNSYYIRFFSVIPSHQSKGLGTLLTSMLEKHYRENNSEPCIFYAYIESKNVKSLKVSEHFETRSIGTMQTTFFSRFFPKKSKKCRSIRKDEISKIQELVASQHNEHIHFHNTKVGYKNNYFVLEADGEIKAGIQIYENTWKVLHNPGFMGFLTMKVFPFIPILRRLADGTFFKFMGIEGIYLNGSLDDFYELLEHILKIHKQHKAFIYLDAESQLYGQLHSKKELGLMDKIQHSPPVSIISSSLNLTEQEEELIQEKLSYISAFDLS